MEKNYKHSTTGQPCDVAQYIAEMMCIRKAESINEGMPADKLWNTEKWKKEYRSQVTRAYQLLRKFDEQVIISALKSPQGKRIYSLRNKSITKLLQQEAKKFKMRKSAEEKQLPLEFKDTSNSKPRKTFGKKSLRSRLDD